MDFDVTRVDYRPAGMPAAEVSLVRLSPDRRQVAFAVTTARGAAIGVSAAVRGEVSPGDAEPVVAATEAARIVVDCPTDRPVDLRWSDDGAWLAYRRGGRPPGFGDRVGWARAEVPGEVGERAGLAFAWAPGRPVLYLADAEAYELRRVEVDTGRSRPLAELVHFHDPRFWPRIAPSPDGQRVAFACRHEPQDANRIWYVEARNGAPAAVFVTRVPGADVHVLPFWSPRGVSLGMHLVHVELERTGLVVLRQLAGEGELLYVHDAIDGAVTPAWAPGGRAIALYRRRDDLDRAAAWAERARSAGPGDAEGEPLDPAAPERQPTGSPAPPLADQILVLLDLATRTTTPLAPPGELAGELRFLDERTLLVDGGTRASLLHLRFRT